MPAQNPAALEPYDHQLECLAALDEDRGLGRYENLVVMATGLGKTTTAAFDARRFLRQHPDARILYLCHQNGILKRARQEFIDIIGGDSKQYGLYHGYRKERTARHLFASFQTMRNKKRLFRRNAFDYIVVDESHHVAAETFLPVVSYFTPQILIGLTATPDRRDWKDIRDVFGGRVTFSLPLPQAIARNLLTPIDYRVITDEVTSIRKIKNPYRLSLKELNRKVFVPRRDEEIVRIILEKIVDVPNPKILIFCSSIPHADRIAAQFPNAATIHSKVPGPEQERREKLFREGRLSAIVTVDKFNEGVDIPDANVLVFLRVTESETIFYQQLGRGLRRAKDKSKVLVLDFVANCQRIRVVHKLAEAIAAERQARQGIAEPQGEGLVLDMGEFNFTEVAHDILRVLRSIESGYTPEVLIAQLQSEAQRLRRTPNADDIHAASRAGRTASVTTFVHVFGSLLLALQAAKLREEKISRHRADLIEQLRAEAELLGDMPIQEDIAAAYKAGRTASVHAMREEFGSWQGAVEAAGLKEYRLKKLVRDLLAEAALLERVPGYEDINQASKEGRTASPPVYESAFGSWNKALEAAGLKLNQRRNLSREDLIRQFREEAERLGRTPGKEDIGAASKAGRTVSPATFRKAFGSWAALAEAAGLTPSGKAIELRKV